MKIVIKNRDLTYLFDKSSVVERAQEHENKLERPCMEIRGQIYTYTKKWKYTSENKALQTMMGESSHDKHFYDLISKLFKVHIMENK